MTSSPSWLYSFVSNWLLRLERMSNRRRAPWLKPWAYRTRVFLFQRDFLTGLFTRPAFIKRVDSALATGKAGALLFVDIDGFAWVNHTLGHVRGDECLQEVAGLLGDTAARRLLGRVGADEFVVYTTNAVEAEELAEQLRLRVERDESLKATREAVQQSPEFCSDWNDRYSPVLTVSIGVIYASAGTSCEPLLQAAKTTLLDAKRAGRNRVAIGTGAT